MYVKSRNLQKVVDWAKDENQAPIHKTLVAEGASAILYGSEAIPSLPALHGQGPEGMQHSRVKDTGRVRETMNTTYARLHPLWIRFG